MHLRCEPGCEICVTSRVPVPNDILNTNTPRLNPRALVITIFLISWYQVSFSQTDTEKVFSAECNPCADSLTSTTRWGVINSKTKKIVLPALYDQVELLGLSFYWVRQNKKAALFKKEKAITGFIYENKYRPDIGGGALGIVVNGKWGCIDTTGRQILDTKYDWVKDQDGDRGVLKVLFQGKWGVTDLYGKEILPQIYDELVDLELYILEKDKKYHVFYPEGRKLSPYTFEEVYTERGSRSLVKLNGRYGYLGPTGDFVIQPTYDKATNFVEQRAAVSRDGKWDSLTRTVSR